MCVEEFAEKIEGVEPYTYRMRKNEGRCIFLKNNLCSIYRIRPIICWAYPFELENLGGKRFRFTYTDECPGIGVGPVLKKAFFKELLREFKKATSEEEAS